MLGDVLIGLDEYVSNTFQMEVIRVSAQSHVKQIFSFQKIQ